ncbi:MAG: hypothetical protein H3C34_00945, partial [Caldilineaceae bacterium]|nr:hypothetical protein [Caldilineaceae bacterium]
EGHSNPNYFLGRIVEDPGPFFYPVAYLFRSTPATLIGLAVAVLGALRRVPPFDQPRVRQAAFGFSLFALLFMLGMSLPAKKFDRYDLPAHFTLEIVAALGWAMLATTAGRYWLRLRRRPADAGPGASSARRAASLPVEVAVLSAGVILLHGAFTALHAPYYLTYYNPLLGGSATAQRALFVGWGEGLDQAGLWLDQQPDDNERRAVSWYAFGPLSYYFDGEVETVIAGSGLPWLDIDFVVLYANQIQRQIPNAAAIHYFLSQDPARVISFRGLELVRIYNMHTLMDEAYANAPDPRPVLVSASWPDLRLASLAMPQRVALGSVLPIHMTFEGTNQKSLKFSARVVNEEGDLIGQTDLPVTPDVTFTVYVPPDAKPGSYALYLMIYEDETLEPVPDSYGETLLTLAPVEVYGGVAYDPAADFRTFNEEE